MTHDTARQQLHGMLKRLRRFAESKAGECAMAEDRREFWRALQKIEDAESILVPPRNLADEYPEAKPLVGGMDEGGPT